MMRRVRGQRLGDRLEIEIRRNGKVYYQEYVRGVATSELMQTPGPACGSAEPG
jgi:DNA gyrase/topoisomerase IV subunit B